MAIVAGAAATTKIPKIENQIFRLTSGMGVVLYEWAPKSFPGCYFTEFTLLS